MTFLILLPAAAGAGVVTPDLRFVPTHLTDDIVAAGSFGPRRLGDRAGGTAAAERAERRCPGRGRWSAHRDLRRPPCRLPDRRERGVVADTRREPPQVADDFLFDPILHRREQREAFLLVLDQRILLAVAAQPDAFLQMVEAVEVILPLRIDDLQHDVAFDTAQDLDRDQRFLL